LASQPTPRYPAGTVRALLETDHVSDATRAALRERLERPAAQDPLYFTNDEVVTLRAVCDRLIPQTDRAQPIDIAGEIDRRLASGETDGWRYDVLPADGEMYRAFFAGLDAIAGARGASAFSALEEKVQDQILSAIQRGEVTGDPWERLPADWCFEEVLAEAAEIYYAHPLAQEEIGYVGMADLPAWTRIGLDESDEREPLPLASR
jgi:gluconate 2-dehydrogenase gamma chain